jgi:hypothetical protein
MKIIKIYSLLAILTSFYFFAELIQIIFSLRSYRLFFKQNKWFYIVNENPLFDCRSNSNQSTGIGCSINKVFLYTNKTFSAIACDEIAKRLTAIEDKIQRRSRGFLALLVRIFNNSGIQLSGIATSIFNSKHLNIRSYEKIFQLEIFPFLLFASDYTLAQDADGMVNSFDI